MLLKPRVFVAAILAVAVIQGICFADFWEDRAPAKFSQRHQSSGKIGLSGPGFARGKEGVGKLRQQASSANTETYTPKLSSVTNIDKAWLPTQVTRTNAGVTFNQGSGASRDTKVMILKNMSDPRIQTSRAYDITEGDLHLKWAKE